MKHMQENEFLHEVFDFTPKKNILSSTDRVSGIDKVSQLNSQQGKDAVSEQTTDDVPESLWRHLGRLGTSENDERHTDFGNIKQTLETLVQQRQLQVLKVVQVGPQSVFKVKQSSTITTADFGNASVAERVIEPTLVMFEFYVPSSCMLDGVHSQHFFGTDVIIHHSENMGLVAINKNTITISTSDIMLSFAAFPVEIPGKVLFLHPVHNYALVAYDPSALGPTGASVAQVGQQPNFF
ncbi:unnamed protein product [Lactuca saligna]|uniref:Uncharacterized protein n=1 Tax=Lactuca saligna TaxID=75948 RepID=A0AA35VI68_LACSI|nr:unnamed protein product [Lactuca saligna]